MKMYPNRTLTSGVLFALVAGICNPPHSSAEECKPLSPGIQQTITSYVQKRYALPNTADLRITDIMAVNGTCYRKLTLESLAARRNVVVYLTPDEGYLAPMLMDLSEDPQIALLRAQTERMKALVAGLPPSQGSADAPVTVVEFGDFQCPACGHLAGLMAQLPADERSKVHLVFRQMPLAKHSWAREAAMLTACVAFQDQRSFWRLQDFVYAEQRTLTAENVRARLARFAKDELQIGPAKIDACIEQRMYEGTLARDAELARRFDVSATPTIFVNGRKYVGMRSIDDLRMAIGTALSEIAPAPKSDGPCPPDGEKTAQ